MESLVETLSCTCRIILFKSSLVRNFLCISIASHYLFNSLACFAFQSNLQSTVLGSCLLSWSYLLFRDRVFDPYVMSSVERPSPRAAIRDWLLHNDGESRTSRPKLDLAEDFEKKRASREEHQSRPHHNARKATSQRGARLSRKYEDDRGNNFEKHQSKLLCPLLGPIVSAR